MRKNNFIHIENKVKLQQLGATMLKRALILKV